MKLHIAAVGRPREVWAKTALGHYQKFLGKYGGIELHFVPSARLGGNVDTARIRALETQRLLDALPDRSTRVFVDQAGRRFTSSEWAANLNRVMSHAPGPVGFLIGGPLGLDLNLRHRGDEIWSLSTLTFPHELALVILCEQLVRGLSILHGGRYHR